MFKTRLGIYTILKISLLIKKTNGEPDFQSKQSHMYVCVEKKNLMIMLALCFMIVEAHGWMIFPK